VGGERAPQAEAQVKALAAKDEHAIADAAERIHAARRAAAERLRLGSEVDALRAELDRLPYRSYQARLELLDQLYAAERRLGAVRR
jgi:hypothetical protein